METPKSSRLSQLKELLEESPGDAFVMYAIATEYKKLGEDELALRSFNNLLEKHPGYISGYYHKSKLLETMGNYAEAMAGYERGMQEATKAGDDHAAGELRAAWSELKNRT